MGTHRAIVEIETSDGDASSSRALDEAWAYWKEAASAILRLWSRGDEGLFKHGGGDDPSEPEQYTEPFTVKPGGTIRILYSSGLEAPLPDDLLDALNTSFVERELVEAPVDGSPFAPPLPIVQGSARPPRARPRRSAPVAPANAAPGATSPPGDPPSTNTLIAIRATVLVLPLIVLSSQDYPFSL